jgi:DNA-binding MarR family transcriptional regulator
VREAAKPVVDRIWKISDQCRQEALAVLNLDEREQLIELLERVHATLSRLESK